MWFTAFKLPPYISAIWASSTLQSRKSRFRAKVYQKMLQSPPPRKAHHAQQEEVPDGGLGLPKQGEEGGGRNPQHPHDHRQGGEQPAQAALLKAGQIPVAVQGL